MRAAALARWNLGRPTLLGDSAHAMVPFVAQGAAQAIMDAAVLGDVLASTTPPEVPARMVAYAAEDRFGSFATASRARNRSAPSCVEDTG